MSVTLAPNFPYSPLKIAIAAACLSFGAILPLDVAIAATESTSSSQRTFSVSVAPGSLAKVLGQFASQTGTALSFDGTSDALSKRSRGIKGQYSVAGGFQQLLQGTGLIATSKSGNGYTVKQVSTDGQNTLPVLDITANAFSNTTEGTGSYTTGSMNTATGLDLSIRETPQSVTVVTSQQMEDRGSTTIKDVYNNTAGITAGSAGTGADPAVFSRGFKVRNLQYDGEAVDFSAFVYEGGSQPDLSTYDRVEIVRGAAGLLNGKGTPSAAINLIRKKPTEEFQASTSASIGRWDKRRIEADVSGALSQDGNIRGRLVAAHQNNESHIDYFEQETNVLYGVTEWDLTPDTLITVGIDYKKSDQKGVGYGANTPLFFSDGSRANLPISTSTSWKDAFNISEKTNFFTALEHNFSDAWSSKVAISHTKIENPFAKAYMVGFPDKETGLGMTVSNLWGGDFERDITNINLSLEGNYTLFNREHGLTLGWSYASNKLDGVQYEARNTGGASSIPRGSIYDLNWDGISFTTNPNAYRSSKVEQSGFYIANIFSITDHSNIVLGARLSSWKERSNHNFLSENFSITSDEEDSGIITPYFGVTYDISEHNTAYASYTSIFEPQFDYDIDNKILDPIEGNNYEIGLKSERYDGKLNLSAAVFRIEQKNLAEQLFDEDGAPITINGVSRYTTVDGVTSEGVELEVSGEVYPGVQVYGGYTHTSIEDNEGKKYNTRIPRDTFSLFATSTLKGDLAGLTLGGGVRWQSDISGESDTWARGPNGEVLKQKSYYLTDVFANYHFNDNLSANIAIGNLFDQKYVERVGETSVVYGEPRNITAKVKYDF